MNIHMLLMYIYIPHHFTSSSAPTQSRQGYYGRYSLLFQIKKPETIVE